jgi:glutamyl-tRNA synthetase
MVNFLALLGWSPGDDTEVMTLDTLLEKFSLDGLQKKAAIFDPQKLDWMNGQHLAMLSLDDLLPHVYPAFERLGVATRAQLEERDEWFRGLLELLRVRSRTVDEIAQQALPYFREDITYDPDAVSKQWRDPIAAAEILTATRERLASLPAWEPTGMESALRALAEELGISGGKIFQPLRVALVGVMASPGIFDVLVVLGRERALDRLQSAVRFLRQDTSI